eukprot:5647062-Amphidinium_carterae.1
MALGSHASGHSRGRSVHSLRSTAISDGWFDSHQLLARKALAARAPLDLRSLIPVLRRRTQSTLRTWH